MKSEIMSVSVISEDKDDFCRKESVFRCLFRCSSILLGNKEMPAGSYSGG